jgi:gluconolactonase
MHDCYDIVDPRFRNFIFGTAHVETIATGMRWAEGPVYFRDARQLVWSDIPNDRMMRWSEGSGVGVFRAPAHYSNGNTRDREGRLVTCEHGSRSVTRTEADGSIVTLVDRFEGKRFNSPNDLCVKSDGTIWFTDPPYGILSDYEGHRGEMEYGGCNVFRFDPSTGELAAVADDFDKPNGIAFSPDERTLYVADSGVTHDPAGPRHIRAFRVDERNRVSASRVFAVIDPGLPDGFRLDVDGNLWTSAGDGVHCFSPQGVLLGRILIPEVVANLVFGGAQRNRLFIAATTSIYAVYVAKRGAQLP